MHDNDNDNNNNNNNDALHLCCFNYVFSSRVTRVFSLNIRFVFIQGGWVFKNTYELLNLRALEMSMLYQNRIFQYG